MFNFQAAPPNAQRTLVPTPSARLAALSGAVVVLLGSASLFAENWPQWRGPGSQGISSETRLPAEWTPEKNILWKVEVPGRGHSAPVVWNDRVFITTAIEGETLPGAKAVEHIDAGKPFLHPDSVGADRRHTYKVLAYIGKTGKLLWEQTAWAGVPFDNRHRRGSYASPSIVTDGKLVFAYFGSEGVFAYDVNGKPAWKASVGRDDERGRRYLRDQGRSETRGARHQLGWRAGLHDACHLKRPDLHSRREASLRDNRLERPRLH